MSVCYDAVGGIGIKLTDEMIEKFIESSLFTQDEWDDDNYECMGRLGILFSSAGDSYSGISYYYLFIKGANLTEINENKSDFMNKLSKYDIFLNVSDLKVIEDLYIS